LLTITVTDGPNEGHTAEATPGQACVIGRQSDWVRLRDPRSSRHHAELKPTDGGWQVVDLGSTNGTYVNGKRIAGPTEIGEGDVIRIGRTHLAVSMMLAGSTASQPALDDDDEVKPDAEPAPPTPAPRVEPAAADASEPEPEPEPEPSVDDQAEATPELGPELLAEPDLEPDPASPAASEAEAEPDIELEPERDQLHEAEAEPEPEPDLESSVEPHAEPKPESPTTPPPAAEASPPSPPQLATNDADDDLPSPDFDDDDDKASLSDSVSAWDELELSPWEEGDDLAQLLSDDDDDDAPASPSAEASATPAAPSTDNHANNADDAEPPSADASPANSSDDSAWAVLDEMDGEPGSADTPAAQADASPDADDNADPAPLSPPTSPQPAVTDSQLDNSEAPDDDPPPILPRRTRGPGTMIWALLLVLLIPAGLWAGQQWGVIDLADWSTRSAEPAASSPSTKDSPDTSADPAASSSRTATVDPSSPQPQARATPEPDAQPTPRVEPTPAPPAVASVPDATAPPTLEPDDESLAEADDDQPLTPSDDPNEAADDDAWLATLTPADSSSWSDPAPRRASSRNRPPHFDTLVPEPAAPAEPERPVADDEPTDAAPAVPETVASETVAPEAAPESPAIAREVELSADDSASDSRQESNASTPQAPEPIRPAADSVDDDAGDLADALAELDIPRAVVTTAASEDAIRFVEVEGEQPNTASAESDAQPADASQPDAADRDALASVDADSLAESRYLDSSGAGRRVVYLVDASGSMIDSFGAVGDWLDKDIAALTNDDRFVVLFFHDGQVLESRPAGLKRPDVRRRSELSVFMRPGSGEVIPSGRSDLTGAIDRALAYRPHRLVLVSDNNLQRRAANDPLGVLVDAIEPAAERVDGFTVDGVQLFYDDPRGLLQSLANAFGGTFHRVTPDAGADNDNPLNFLLR